MLEKINSLDQFNEILANKDKFFLMKHSLTCPISQAAYREYQKFSDENSGIPTYYLAVQDSRPLSNAIADQFQIKHESPQAILFSNKAAVWNMSHWQITQNSLSQAAKS